MRGLVTAGRGTLETVWLVFDAPVEPLEVLARHGLRPLRSSLTGNPSSEKSRARTRKRLSRTQKQGFGAELSLTGKSLTENPSTKNLEVESPEKATRTQESELLLSEKSLTGNPSSEKGEKTGGENPVQDEVLSSDFSGGSNILLETKTNTTKTTTSSPSKGREEKFIYGQWYSREYLDFYNGLPLAVQVMVSGGTRPVGANRRVP